MRIGEFFIALGFEVKGKEDLEKTDQGMQKLEFSGLKLVAAVTAMNAAFYAMIATAVEAGSVLQKFALTTGLSTDELQRWQLAAIKGNVAADTIAKSISAIQKARAGIAFGNAEAAAPWLLLGIDPRQDPFKVFDQLQRKIQSMDPAIAKKILGDMGLSEDVLVLIKQGGLARGNLPKSLTITTEETTNLMGLGAAWKEMLFSLGQFLTRFGAQFAAPFTEVLKQVTRFMGGAGRFIDWLEGGSKAAEIFMQAMIAMVVVMTGLGIAAGVLILGPFGVFAATILIMVGALATLVLLIQDFWTACRGGKSAFDWNDNLLLSVKNVEALSLAITVLLDAWDRLVTAVKSGKGVLSVLGDIGAAAGGDPSRLIGNALLDKNSLTNQNIQTNHIQVSVPAASNPHETGRDVGRSASRQISDAFGQLPAPSR